MRFRKGRGRKKKIDWKGKRIEEVREIKNFGYTLMRNGGQEAHIRERRKKAAIVMREAWGIGKRIWEKDWERRMWLYDTLIWMIMGYGAEGMERREVEVIHEKFIRCTIGLDWRTPGYMVREETDRWMMRGRAGRRAWTYEEKLKEGRGGVMAS